MLFHITPTLAIDPATIASLQLKLLPNHPPRPGYEA